MRGLPGAERRDQQGVGAVRQQRIADRVAVGAGAGEPMAGEHVGQRRERRAVLDAGDQLLQRRAARSGSRRR